MNIFCTSMKLFNQMMIPDPFFVLVFLIKVRIQKQLQSVNSTSVWSKIFNMVQRGGINNDKTNDPNFVPKYLLKEDEDNLGDVIGDIFGLTNPVIVEAMDGTFDVLKCQSYVFTTTCWQICII